MARLVLAEAASKSFDLLPEDSIHEATVSDIETSFYDDPVNGPRNTLNWTFTIHTPGDWDGKRIWANSSMVFNTNQNCKLRNWAMVILGVELEKDYELDTDDLVGRKVRVVVRHKRKQDGSLKQEVGDLMPSKATDSSWNDSPF